MTANDIKKMEKSELVYNMILSTMTYYKMSFGKITLHRKKNTKGRYIADFVFYLYDTADNTHVYKYRLYDDDYLWLCVALANDFPEVELVDLTDEKDKVVKNVWYRMDKKSVWKWFNNV